MQKNPNKKYIKNVFNKMKRMINLEFTIVCFKNNYTIRIFFCENSIFCGWEQQMLLFRAALLKAQTG
jgi:hypothetical protein